MRFFKYIYISTKLLKFIYLSYRDLLCSPSNLIIRVHVLQRLEKEVSRISEAIEAVLGQKLILLSGTIKGEWTKVDKYSNIIGCRDKRILDEGTQLKVPFPQYDPTPTTTMQTPFTCFQQ